MNKKLCSPNSKFNFDLEFKTKSVDEEGFFIIGLASTPALDRHGETITEEALKKAANSLLKKPNNVLFLNHNYDKPIGVILESKYTGGGLMIKAKLSETVPVLQMQIKEGLWNAFSIGGIVKKAEEIKDKEGNFQGYKILEIELVEVSLVGVPANPEATLLEVISKSLNSKQNEEGEDMKKNKIKKDEELEEKEVNEVEEDEKDSKVDDEVVDDKKEDNDNEDDSADEDAKDDEDTDEEDKEDEEDSDEDENNDDSDDDSDDVEDVSLEDVAKSIKEINKKLDSFLTLSEDIKAIKEATVVTVKDTDVNDEDTAENEQPVVKEKKKIKRKGVVDVEKETEEEKLLKKLETMSLKDIMNTPEVWDKLDDEMKKQIKNQFVANFTK